MDPLAQLAQLLRDHDQQKQEIKRLSGILDNLQGTNGIAVNLPTISFDPRSLKIQDQATGGTRYEFEVNEDGVQVTYTWVATRLG